MAYVKSSLIPQGILDMIAINNAEEGAICSFNTDLNMEMYECICQINASGGNGSPDSPIPIVGHSELNLVRCGVNHWNGEYEEGEISYSDGQDRPSSSYWRTVGYIPIVPNATYYIYSHDGQYPRGRFYGADKSYLGTEDKYGNDLVFNSTFTAPENAYFLRFAPAISVSTTASVNYPSTDTAYHAYNGTPYLVQFGQTVYGGVYDANAGVLTCNYGIVDLGDLIWAYDAGHTRFNAEMPSDYKIPADLSQALNIICSCYLADLSPIGNQGVDYTISGYTNNKIYTVDRRYTDGGVYKREIAGQKLVYKLATPIEIDVSELSVDTIVGVNNMFHDCNGTTKGKFFETVGHNIA